MPLTEAGDTRDKGSLLCVPRPGKASPLLAWDLVARVPLSVAGDEAEVAARDARVDALLARPLQRRCRRDGHVVGLDGPEDFCRDGAAHEV